MRVDLVGQSRGRYVAYVDGSRYHRTVTLAEGRSRWARDGAVVLTRQGRGPYWGFDVDEWPTTLADLVRSEDAGFVARSTSTREDFA